MKVSNALRIVLAWLAAVLVAAALGSLVQSQFNMAAIAGLGVEVPVREWGRAAAHDLVHFGPFWAAVVGVALLFGFPVAAGLARFASGARHALYFLAGGVAVMCALVIMSALLPVTLVAAARHATGMALMALGGAVGGLVFAQLSERPPSSGSG